MAIPLLRKCIGSLSKIVSEFIFVDYKLCTESDFGVDKKGEMMEDGKILGEIKDGQ